VEVRPLTSEAVTRLYFLKGSLSVADVETLCKSLFCDPVTERYTLANTPPLLAQDHHAIEVTTLPGVTDSVAESILRAAPLLGVKGLEQAATGVRHAITGTFTPEQLTTLATTQHANPVIQRYTIDQPITPPFMESAKPDLTVETIPLQSATDADLEALSKTRRLSLNLAEMKAIQAYFVTEKRDPTDAELEMIAQTWSEHCVHKTFKAAITYTGPLPGKSGDPVTQQIDGLLKTYLKAATDKLNKSWVKSAFVDNAGIISFNEGWELAFKAETHNHPSALEPFGGANTGVGGVVRDILGVSAKPIANTDVLCFGVSDDGIPPGVLPPTRVEAGVIHGIEDYGNKMGIPTVNGAIFYHPGYTANPLVFCGCVGLLPAGSHLTGAQADDLVVVLGGRTGRDGLRGATFSSAEMDVTTSQIAGSAVQIGHAIHEKQVQEVILRARDAKLYHAVTDCGAGGLSSAVGEMGATLGAKVDLAKVPLKYTGLRPWEIWLSEAQERMLLAIPAANWSDFEALCKGQDIEAVQIGTFGTLDAQLILTYGDQKVGTLSMEWLHNGIPPRQLTATWSPTIPTLPATTNAISTPADTLMKLLAHPNIRSKEAVVRRYDHEVQGGMALKPFTGVADHAPSDAAILIPPGTFNPEDSVIRGVALANGLAPLIGERDPYLMAFAAVDETFRNLVAAGADPEQVALLDNFCWGNPGVADRLGGLVRCAQGCYDAALQYGAPYISGKDSLNNEYTTADGNRHAIPGTLLISAMGIVPDVKKTVTMPLKKAGNLLYLVGITRDELGGSHYEQVTGAIVPGNKAPQPNPDAPEILRILHKAISAGLIVSCHDLSEGGLAVALAEMCIGGRLGAKVTLPNSLGSADKTLFSESLTRFLIEVNPGDSFKVQRIFRNFSTQLGTVREGNLEIVVGGETAVNRSVEDLETAWRGTVKISYPVIDLPQRKSNANRPERRTSTVTGRPKAVILHANGTNRDQDVSLALQMAGADPEIVHVNQLINGDRKLSDYHLLIVPGGFSYGDDLGAGVLWSLDLTHRLKAGIDAFIQDGRPVLAICNGFQALVKAGVLPGGQERQVTLTYNDSGRFECRWVYLQPTAGSVSLWTEGLSEPIYCPVAHGEGRLMVKNPTQAEKLWSDGLVALVYSDDRGNIVGYPGNPNGSVEGIAALCNPAGNVLGLMPHPENHLFAWQHPRRETRMSGLKLFKNGVKYA
jgi:phosphoribosylformylglycinamidine synthase